jgi:cryptochrome 1
MAMFSDPISLVRDHKLKEMLAAEGIVVQSFNADLLYDPWEVNDDEGNPFNMFMPFWNRCLSMPYDPPAPLLPPKKINSGDCPISNVVVYFSSEHGVYKSYVQSSVFMS